MKKLFILCFLIVIFLSGVSCAESQNSSELSVSTDPENASENIEDQMPLEASAWFYYAENGSIYKQDGENQKILLKEKTVEPVSGKVREYYTDTFAENGWIYYITHKKDTPRFSLCCMDSEGNQVSELVASDMFASDESFNSCVFYDGKVYIQTNFKFYRYDMEQGDFEKLSNDVGIYQIFDRCLYFIDHANRTFTIYRMDLQSLKTEILLGKGQTVKRGSEETLYTNILFVGENLYYTTRIPSGLYCYQSGGTDLLISCGDQEYFLNEYSLFEYNGTLCYVLQSVNGKGRLMQYDPESRQIAFLAVCDEYSSSGHIENGQFYYKNDNGEEKVAELQKL